MATRKTEKTEQGLVEKVEYQEGAADTQPEPTDTLSASPATDDEEAAQRAREGAERAAATDAGADQVQAKLDQEQEKGYLGEVADPVPNEVYSLPHPSYGEGGQVAPEVLGVQGRALADAHSRGVTADALASYQQQAQQQQERQQQADQQAKEQ